MRQTWSDALADALRLAVILRRIIGQRIQDEDLAPLGALVERSQQLVYGLRVYLHQRLTARAGLVDLGQRSYRIRDHLVIIKWLFVALSFANSNGAGNLNLRLLNINLVY